MPSRRTQKWYGVPPTRTQPCITPAVDCGKTKCAMVTRSSLPPCCCPASPSSSCCSTSPRGAPVGVRVMWSDGRRSTTCSVPDCHDGSTKTMLRDRRVQNSPWQRDPNSRPPDTELDVVRMAITCTSSAYSPENASMTNSVPSRHCDVAAATMSASMPDAPVSSTTATRALLVAPAAAGSSDSRTRR